MKSSYLTIAIYIRKRVKINRKNRRRKDSLTEAKYLCLVNLKNETQASKMVGQLFTKMRKEYKGAAVYFF